MVGDEGDTDEDCIPLSDVRKRNAANTTTDYDEEDDMPLADVVRMLNSHQVHRDLDISEDERLQEAIDLSRQEELKRAAQEAEHTLRLDKLLKEHHLVRLQVPGDGNCMFNATAIQIGSNAETVRERICKHLETEPENYKKIMPVSSDTVIPVSIETESESYKKIIPVSSDTYQSQVNKLRTIGHWNADIADLIPMALADVFQRNIMIYSSNIDNPVVHIHPTNGTPTVNSASPLMYSLLSIPGHEHYDYHRSHP